MIGTAFVLHSRDEVHRMGTTVVFFLALLVGQCAFFWSIEFI